jgi:hypothetical protein
MESIVYILFTVVLFNSYFVLPDNNLIQESAIENKNLKIELINECMQKKLEGMRDNITPKKKKKNNNNNRKMFSLYYGDAAGITIFLLLNYYISK